MKATDFCHHIWALGDSRYIVFPRGKYLFALFFIGPHAKWGTKVIQYHGRAGHSFCEIEECFVLIVVMPGIIGEAAFAQTGNALPEGWTFIEIGRRTAGDGEHFGVMGVRACMANAFEEITTCLYMGVENFIQVIMVQVGPGDDAGNGCSSVRVC
ncbi:unnamed protein product [Effrenium voratum]|nr:unnamed protein product [Effrenium voratum]